MASLTPYVGNYNFLVEISGIGEDSSMVVGGFAEVDGLGSETEVIEFAEGGSSSVHKIPGRTRFSNVVLRRGVTNSNELYRWRRSAEDGSVEPRSGSIVLLGPDSSERARWNFYDAWPCRYEAPNLVGDGNAVSVETLELCVGRVERVDS